MPRRPTAQEIQTMVADLESQARSDFLWTCAHLLKIKPEDRPLAPLELIDTQRYLYERYAKPAKDARRPLALVILKARRARVSTFWEAWFYWACRWYPGQAILIAAHLDRSVNELYEMVVRFHEHLPEELRPPTKALNRKELAYAGLDSSISVEAARYMDISRGQLINHCHVAEAPYLPDPETIMSGLVDSVPRTGWSTIVLEGTANGMGTWFHEFWKDVGRRQGRPALGGRRWERCFIPWFAHPSYYLPVPKHFELTEDEAEMQREHGLATEQLVWYRAAWDEMETLHPGRGKFLMQQENPSTDTEAFLASGSVIFPPELIDPLKKDIRNPTLGFRFERSGPWQWGLRACAVSEAPLLVWEAPQAGSQYAIGVDVASGTGGHESAIVVVRMPGFVQVAEWGDAHTSTADLAGIVACVARYYASQGQRHQLPVVNVDITGGWGADTNNRLGEFYAAEPFQLYIWEPFDRLAPAEVTAASRTGWVFTWVSKNVLISTAVSLLQERMVVVPSQTMQEDVRQLDEERLGKRMIVQMSGNDRATAWLLALVAAWKKIARWAWVGTAREAPREATVWRDPSRYDTTIDELLKPATVGPHSTAGDKDTPWLVQW